jgi:exodeoxyribonuclease VII large subunit
MAAQPQTVSAVVAALKALVDPAFRSVWVTGELSGVKRHPSGHWYFTLKDEAAQLRGVMFRRDADRLAFPLANGQQVAIRGRLAVYERDGQTQIYATTIEPVGAGAALLALEALKRRLSAEGLFDRSKRRWPLIPHCIAVSTAESGAARRDIEAVTGRRFPGLPLDLIPAAVQGDQAVPSLVAALAQVDPARHDVVILGRGGGATEDLQAFNAEAVVRAVAACPVPVIAAVGHEIDKTLADLAADARASTPSAAAEMAVPDRQALLTDLMQRRARWQQGWQGWTTRQQEALDRRRQHPLWSRPQWMAQVYERAWATAAECWDRAWESFTSRLQHQLALRQTRWAAFDPARILAQGYAIVTDVGTGRVVTAATAGETVRIRWADGERVFADTL